jgi:hypothetical protein
MIRIHYHRHGSADPDPHQNVMDPQHWYAKCTLCAVHLSCNASILSYSVYVYLASDCDFSETVFLNFQGALELFPRNRF